MLSTLLCLPAPMLPLQNFDGFPHSSAGGLVLEVSHDLDGLNMRSTVSYESLDEHRNFAYLLNPGPQRVYFTGKSQMFVRTC